MGVSTTYLGHIEVTPHLNEAERDYLTAISRSPGAGGGQGLTP